MPRQKLPPGEKRVMVTHLIAPETKQRLDELAADTGDSRGVLIDKAVEAYKPKRQQRP